MAYELMEMKEKLGPTEMLTSVPDAKFEIVKTSAYSGVPAEVVDRLASQLTKSLYMLRQFNDSMEVTATELVKFHILTGKPLEVLELSYRYALGKIPKSMRSQVNPLELVKLSAFAQEPIADLVDLIISGKETFNNVKLHVLTKKSIVDLKKFRVDCMESGINKKYINDFVALKAFYDVSLKDLETLFNETPSGDYAKIPLLKLSLSTGLSPSDLFLELNFIAAKIRDVELISYERHDLELKLLELSVLSGQKLDVAQEFLTLEKSYEEAEVINILEARALSVASQVTVNHLQSVGVTQNDIRLNLKDRHKVLMALMVLNEPATEDDSARQARIMREVEVSFARGDHLNPTICPGNT